MPRSQLHGVPRKDELIVHACDECFALRDAFAGRRWADIPVRQIHEHYSELPLFSPVAHHYYLPAFVIAATDSTRRKDLPILDMVKYDLCALPKESVTFSERFELFSPPQLTALSRWLFHMLSYRDIYDLHADARWPHSQDGRATTGLAGARPSSTARLIGPTFQELEGFVVASAVEEVGQARRDGLGEGCYQRFNMLGNFAQTLHVLLRVAPALFVRNNFQPFSQCLGQFAFRFRHQFEKKLCLGRAEARPSAWFFVLIARRKT